MTITALPPTSGAGAAGPPPLSPRRRTAVRATLVAVAGVVTVGCVVALGMAAWGISAYRVAADEKALPADLRSLIVDVGDVPAAVRLTTDPEATQATVSMRLIDSARSGGHTLELREESGTTRVTVSGERSEFMDWGRTGEITVTLPPETARRLSVTAQLDDGVLLVNANLDSLVVHNLDGEVLLGGSARNVEVHTRDGRIVAHDPIAVGESFFATAVDGDVDVDFANTPPRNVSATTRDGDVEFSLPEPGPYLVQASGDSTRVSVPQTGDRSLAAGTVTVRTVDGNVVIDTLERR